MRLSGPTPAWIYRIRITALMTAPGDQEHSTISEALGQGDRTSFCYLGVSFHAAPASRTPFPTILCSALNAEGSPSPAHETLDV